MTGVNVRLSSWLCGFDKGKNCMVNILIASHTPTPQTQRTGAMKMKADPDL